jgi:hypothetical protein
VKKISAAIQVLRHGSAVADPATWKSRQVAANALLGLLVGGSALASAFGWIPEPLSQEILMQVAEGAVLVVLAVINILATWATSEKVGVGKKLGPPSSAAPAAPELRDTADDVQAVPRSTAGKPKGKSKSPAEDSRSTWLD